MRRMIPTKQIDLIEELSKYLEIQSQRIIFNDVSVDFRSNGETYAVMDPGDEKLYISEISGEEDPLYITSNDSIELNVNEGDSVLQMDKNGVNIPALAIAQVYRSPEEPGISIDSYGDSYGEDGISLTHMNSSGDTVGKIEVSGSGVIINGDVDQTFTGYIQLIGSNENAAGCLLLDYQSGSLTGHDSNGDTVGEVKVSDSGVTINGDVDNTGSGYILMPDLPTSDPQVEGALWNDNGVLKISAGQ